MIKTAVLIFYEFMHKKENVTKTLITSYIAAELTEWLVLAY